MRRRLSILLGCVLFLMSSIVTYATPPKETEEKDYSVITVKEDALNEQIVTLEEKYDLNSNMPEEALTTLSAVSNVKKDVERLDDSHIQVTYTFSSKEPVSTIASDLKDEHIYNATSYTYVLAENSSGSTSETKEFSDVTIKNTVYYTYYNEGTLKMLKVTSGTTSITKSLEHDLRNLVLQTLSQGTSSGGFTDEYNSRTIETPSLNTEYSLSSGFQHSYSTISSKIQYGAKVTYSHGSSYTVHAYISLGTP